MHPNCSSSSNSSSDGSAFGESSANSCKDIDSTEQSDSNNAEDRSHKGMLSTSPGSIVLGQRGISVHSTMWRPGGAVQEAQPWLLGGDGPPDVSGTKDSSAFRGFNIPANPGEFARSDPYWWDTVPVGGQYDLLSYLRVPGAPPLQGAWRDATYPLELPLWLRDQDMLKDCTADDKGRLVMGGSQTNPIWRCLGAAPLPAVVI